MVLSRYPRLSRPSPGTPEFVVGVALLVGPELGQDHLEDPHEDEQVDLGGGDRAHRAQPWL